MQSDANETRDVFKLENSKLSYRSLKGFIFVIS